MPRAPIETGTGAEREAGPARRTRPVKRGERVATARPPQEFVVVQFDESRVVEVDGRVGGHTNEIIAVAPGKHRFRLAGPSDHLPDAQIVAVYDTRSDAPLIVPFYQVLRIGAGRPRAAILAEVTAALAITIALEDSLAALRSNSDEAEEARSLLAQQRRVLGDVMGALRFVGELESKRQEALELLARLSRSLLTVIAKEGPARGIVAAATITLANVLGADLHWVSQAIVTGSIVGEGVVEQLTQFAAAWRHRDRKAD